MPSFAITCVCGERFQIEERHLGKVISCWKCKRQMRAKRPAASGGASKSSRPRTRRKFSRPNSRGIAVAIIGTVARALPFGSRWRGVGPAVLALLAWGLCGTMIGIAALMWQLGDRFPIATILLFVGRWIYFVPLVGLALLAYRQDKALYLPLGIAAWVTIVPVMGFSLGWRRVLPAPDGTRIRVVSFNTAGNPLVTDSLPALLGRWNADIVALQECSVDLAQRLPAVAGWHVHAVRPLCLLSRFPITAAETMDRSSLERVRSEGVAGVGGAGFVVRYALETPAGPVGFTNLHLETARKGLETLLDGLDFGRLRENSDLRDIEGERARAWVNGGMVPTIVAGDFNAPREGRNFTDHWGDMRSAFDDAGLGFGYTRYNGWIRVRIDHVLYGQGLRATRTVIGADAFSDHRPIIADLVRLRRVVD